MLIHSILNSEKIEEKEMANALLTETGKIFLEKKEMVHNLRNSKIIVPANKGILQIGPAIRTFQEIL